MANLRKPRYLSCFCCGKRTSKRYDGRIRNFECPTCEAVNYLDENGEITDPPVATTRVEPPAVQYVKAQRSSPQPSNPSSAIFCSTCLKNQHLFTASLAQYLPGDPNHPDYAELERNYFKFRKGLEQRYPQVCAECEPRVLNQINQAGYTAKTDHLRRMIERSRDNRHINQGSPIGVLSYLGWRLWQAGLVFQLLWHIVALYTIYATHLSGSEPDDILYRFIQILGTVFGALPSANRLIKWSIFATLASCWWNPKFTQSVRGFTRPIIGLRTWYTYQAMILFLRLSFPRLVAQSSEQASQLPTQLGAHAFMAVFILYIYKLASQSVRVDTAPLFGPKIEGFLSRRNEQGSSLQKPSDENISELLDDMLVGPSSTIHTGSPVINQRRGPGLVGQGNHRTPVSSSLRSSTSALDEDLIGFRPRDKTSGFDVRPARVFDNDSRPKTPNMNQQDDEMDWSPIQSSHRAFSSSVSAERNNQGFGQTPTEPHAGTFWYRVPAAPTNPAQRLFNPPNPPRLRQSPVTQEEVAFGKRAPGGLKDEGKEAGITFSQGSFFAPTQNNDPRNSLSDLFGQSFSLSQEPQGAQQAGETRSPLALSTNIFAGAAELAILLVLMPAWVYTASTQTEYSQHISLGALCTCIVISVRGTSVALLNLRSEKPGRWKSAVKAILGMAEVLFAIRLSFQIMISDGLHQGCVNQGLGLIGVMLAHQVWNVSS